MVTIINGDFSEEKRAKSAGSPGTNRQNAALLPPCRPSMGGRRETEGGDDVLIAAGLQAVGLGLSARAAAPPPRG